MTAPDHPRASGGSQTLKAAIVIVVVVVVGWLVLKHNPSKQKAAGPTTTVHSATVPSTAATTTTTVPLIPPSSIKLQVLNGVGSGSLAGEWSSKLKTEYGYQYQPPDNATAVVTTSTIYVMTAGYVPEADRLATQVGLTPAIVDPTIPAPASAPIPASERAGANLVLVIGPNLASTA